MLSEAVQEAFLRMHAKGMHCVLSKIYFNRCAGLIYRENRLINWCCALKTAISDIEVEFRDISGPTEITVPGQPGRGF